jgi:hypothetical protein
LIRLHLDLLVEGKLHRILGEWEARRRLGHGWNFDARTASMRNFMNFIAKQLFIGLLVAVLPKGRDSASKWDAMAVYWMLAANCIQSAR